jgi:hypothetical protein
MEEPRSGLGIRVIAWIVLLVVAFFAIKFVFGIVAGIVTAIFWAAILVVAVMGVLWALRHI